MTTRHFLKANTKSSDLLQLIHSDLCAPIIPYTQSEGAFSPSLMKVFEAEVENWLDNKTKALMFDRDGEYSFNTFESFMYEIVPNTTAPSSPQINGAAGSRSQTLSYMMHNM